MNKFRFLPVKAFQVFLAVSVISCSKYAGNSGSGQLRLRFDGSSIEAVSRAVGENVPDTNDFILEITGPDGAAVYNGPYGLSPESITVPAGSCTVSIRSRSFSRPEFASPQYGDDRCILVPEDGIVEVTLACTQLNSGIRLKVDSGFLTSFPDGVLFVRGMEGQLMYGYSEKRTAYFLPGNISVILDNAGKENVLMTRSLAPREILTVSVEVASGVGTASSGGISVQIDTSRVWLEDGCVIGGDDIRGDTCENALSVSQAKSCIGEKDVWVTGYIVGGDLTSSDSGISFEPPFKASTNLAIAARGAVSEKSSCIAVQLPSGDVRDEVNLVSHPDLLGRRVSFKGDITSSYFGLTGLKEVTDYVIH